MVADYNGWADLPESEREALDTFELGAALEYIAASTPNRRIVAADRTPARAGWCGQFGPLAV